MTTEELAELMAEAPADIGRTRKAGVWRDLEPVTADCVMRQDEMEILPAEYGRRTTPKPKRSKPADTIRHGTRSAYVNDYCRCDACRGAEAKYQRAYYAKRRQHFPPIDQPRVFVEAESFYDDPDKTIRGLRALVERGLASEPNPGVFLVYAPGRGKRGHLDLEEAA